MVAIFFTASVINKAKEKNTVRRAQPQLELVGNMSFIRCTVDATSDVNIEHLMRQVQEFENMHPELIVYIAASFDRAS